MSIETVSAGTSGLEPSQSFTDPHLLVEIAIAQNCSRAKLVSMAYCKTSAQLITDRHWQGMPAHDLAAGHLA